MSTHDDPNKVAIGDVVGGRSHWVQSSSDTLVWMASLLRREGVDLMEASESDLSRGTPVYVEADVDALEVQRRMAQSHIRRLPVVQGEQLVGLVDLLDLAVSEDLRAAAEERIPVGEAEPAVLPPLDETDRPPAAS